MNTVILKKDFLELKGFDLIQSQAYFSFRNGAITISPFDMEVLSQKKYEVLNHCIYNKTLVAELLDRGYLNMNFFILNNNVYYCIDPESKKSL